MLIDSFLFLSITPPLLSKLPFEKKENYEFVKGNGDSDDSCVGDGGCVYQYTHDKQQQQQQTLVTVKSGFDFLPPYRVLRESQAINSVLSFCFFYLSLLQCLVFLFFSFFYLFVSGYESG